MVAEERERIEIKNDSSREVAQTQVRNVNQKRYYRIKW
jgi:hypothetical protein